jgi:hypothetical protein
MSMQSTILAWQTWLAAQAPPLNTQTFRHAPPWPYAGTYPYVIILPGTQYSARYSDAEVYWSGWWRLLYVDLVGRSGGFSTVHDLLEAAGAWADALCSTLRSSANNRSLGGLVDYVGESPAASDGLASQAAGIVVQWDDKGTGLDTNETPYWSLPVAVFVRERPALG